PGFHRSLASLADRTACGDSKRLFGGTTDRYGFARFVGAPHVGRGAFCELSRLGPDSDFGSRAHARSRARSSTPPAPTEVPAVPAAMVDAPAVAVTLPPPVRAPVASSPCDAAAEAPGSNLVPPRSVTHPVGSSETASATPHDASASSPPSVLQEPIYEITIEGLCGDDVGGDVADDDSVAAEDVPLQAVVLLNDEVEEDSQRSKRTRLRRGDETSEWHPFPLPKAPERHPTTNHRNLYNPDAPWDYANSAGITRLLDVEGESPHRCYLVQWKGRPLQMSWVWMELLDKESTRYMMQKVDEWTASCSKKTFMGWYDVRDSASEAGTRFIDAFRCALYHLGRPNLRDVTEFWKTLQRQSVQLNYGTMLPNILHGSIGSVATLERFFAALVPGTYLVSAGQDDVGHCFVVVKTGPNARLVVLDGTRLTTIHRWKWFLSRTISGLRV
ncbi:hypothetical protein L914_01189, partial [Phytophthora nicotianae]